MTELKRLMQIMGANIQVFWKRMTSKTKLRLEYTRRLKRILKSHLNNRNVITAISARALSIIRYSAGIMRWTEKGLDNLDRKTRKTMTLYCIL